jgi:hypothetical protein
MSEEGGMGLRTMRIHAAQQPRNGIVREENKGWNERISEKCEGERTDEWK